MSIISLKNAGKMYKVYSKPFHRILDQFNVPVIGKKDKRYSEIWALKDINVELKKGERLGIIGKNGAGKSTLLKIICSRLELSTGSFNCNSKIHALLELGTGFYPEFTGRENIETSLCYNGFSNDEIPEMMEEIIEFSELWDFIDQPVKTYSSGMYARLGFATATSLRPEILVIDEVFSAGDASFIGKCTARMKKLTDTDGVTVVFVTHAISMMERFCNRCILLQKGELIDDGDPLRISKRYSQMIREEEEINLRSRKGLVRKRSFSYIPGKATDREYLFRLRGKDLKPDKEHLISKINLKINNVDIAKINVGEKNDDDASFYSRLIVDKGYQNWSSPVVVNEEAFRYFRDEKGRYLHAPFILTIPPGIDLNETTIHIEGIFHIQEELRLELFLEGKYMEIGRINGNNKLEEISFPVGKKDLATDLKENDESFYGSGEARLSDVELLDGKDKPRRVFTTGDAFKAILTIETFRRIDEFVLVFCINNIDTTSATQVFYTKEDSGLEYLDGRYVFNMEFSPLMLGRGHYIVSIGLYKFCDMGEEKENPSYFVLDRALEFKVEQPDGIRKELGRFVHPVNWTIEQKN